MSDLGWENGEFHEQKWVDVTTKHDNFKWTARAQQKILNMFPIEMIEVFLHNQLDPDRSYCPWHGETQWSLNPVPEGSHGHVFVPECVARVPVSLRVWGRRVCSLDVTFAFATVGSRPRVVARGLYGRAFGEFCNSGYFWRFYMLRSFVSRGRRGTLWHSNMFHNAPKVALWRPTSSFRLQAQHLRRVVLCVFLNRIVRAAWSGDNRRGILWDVIKDHGSLARNIDFEVANRMGCRPGAADPLLCGGGSGCAAAISPSERRLVGRPELGHFMGFIADLWWLSWWA